MIRQLTLPATEYSVSTLRPTSANDKDTTTSLKMSSKILDQKTKPNCTPVFRRWFYPLCDYKPNQIFWTFEPGAICEVKYGKMNRKKRRIESGDSLFRGSEYFVSLNLRKLMMSLSVETCSICFAFYHRLWGELMVFFQMYWIVFFDQIFWTVYSI